MKIMDHSRQYEYLEQTDSCVEQKYNYINDNYITASCAIKLFRRMSSCEIIHRNAQVLLDVAN